MPPGVMALSGLVSTCVFDVQAHWPGTANTFAPESSIAVDVGSSSTFKRKPARSCDSVVEARRKILGLEIWRSVDATLSRVGTLCNEPEKENAVAALNQVETFVNESEGQSADAALGLVDTSFNESAEPRR